jgi:diaminohydroxyphosphoribosylaminopyrimidine deaminase/5-amino-6-(5-phosphoribosylamino)uracil reductase
MKQQTHDFWMQKALDEAEKGRGYVSPNPVVGCLIISKEGKLLSKGYHERFGQAHAEVNAVKAVKNPQDLVGATVYVSLEPCSHHGKTPPCADMLASLPIKKVVVAIADPNPQVSGRGLAILRAAGKEIEIGILADKATRQNEFFLHHIKTGKPFITLKWAQTLDGYVAAPNGTSQWISGKSARTKVHEWRAQYDAVLVGRQTAKLDNPSLTVRMIQGRQPKRILVDGPGTSSRSIKLLSDQFEENTIIITHNPEFLKVDDPLLALLTPDYFRGKRILVGKKEGHTDLNEAFIELGKMGIASILIEAGSQLSTALLKQNLVDKLHVFVAPKLMGGGKPAVNGLGLSHIDDAFSLKNSSWEQVGEDLLFTAYL